MASTAPSCLLKKYFICRRGRTKPPIEPVGQSAFPIICPNALCLYNLSRHAPHNDHFHESNGKQYCMLIQHIVGGYINPLLPVVREINRCKHDATTPSGFAAGYRRDVIAVVYLYQQFPSTGGELALAVLFQQPIVFALGGSILPLRA